MSLWSFSEPGEPPEALRLPSYDPPPDETTGGGAESLPDLVRAAVVQGLRQTVRAGEVLPPNVIASLASTLLRQAPAESPATVAPDAGWPGLEEMTDAELADLRRLVKKARG